MRNSDDEEEEQIREDGDPQHITSGAKSPLEWWKEHHEENPLPSKLVKQYLCRPETTVSAKCA